MAKAKYYIQPGDKIKVIATGEQLTVIASTTAGVYAMHVTPLKKPHKDARFFPYKDIANVNTT